jgi:tRNA(Arg) A34 adenosine deaminase TadA
MDSSDDFWIRAAIDLAQESRTPYGALIVDQGDQYVSGYNTTIHDGATAHAEINAIKKIADLDYNTAEDLTLYTTVEPCPMCMSAIIWAGIGRVVYGTTIEYAQQFGKQIQISAKEVAAASWYPIEITAGIEARACEVLFK